MTPKKPLKESVIASKKSEEGLEIQIHFYILAQNPNQC